MGYYSTYVLTVNNCTFADYQEVIAAIRKEQLDEFVFFENEPEYDPNSMELEWVSGFTKWYDEEKDMRKLSCLFPDKLFRIQGFGEENLDYWYELFQCGEYEYMQGRMVYDKPKRFPLWEPDAY